MRTLLAVSAFGLFCQAPSDAGILASYTKARAVLDAAISAHGGIDALRAVETMRVDMRGTDLQRYQSPRPDPPFGTQPAAFRMMVDLPRGRLVTETTQQYFGGFRRHYRWATDNNGRDYYADLLREYFDVRELPAAETQTGNLFYLPQFLLLRANSAHPSLRYVGRMRLSSGAEVDVITAAPAGNMMTLAFDVATKQLRANLSVRGDSVLGDIGVETEFVGYRQIAGVLMPSRRVVRFAGEVAQDFEVVSVTRDYRVPDELMTPPSHFVENAPAPATNPVRELAPGVWTINEGGAHSLAVAFADHVLVVEAPADPSGVIRRLATLAAGKPVRYVVPTHHHDDHASGVRHYAALGATIVTTPGNRGVFTRMTGAEMTLGAGASVKPTRSPRIEFVDGMRTFTDGSRSVEIHSVGPNPHAGEMLIAWIPDAGVLFQGDLIDVVGSGAVRPNMNTAATVSFAEWLKTRNWNVRVFAGTHGPLHAPADFAAILKQR